MNLRQLVIGIAALWCAGSGPPAFGQDAILPQGDPRLKDSAVEQQHREEIRDSRLKQQGQGSNYRVEGALQGGSNEATAGDSDGLSKQDTGLADPSVNPGQAQGMKTVQGRIVKSDENAHIVRQPTGGDRMIIIDGETKGDRDLRPGDVVTGMVTPQGRAVVMQKESQEH